MYENQWDQQQEDFLRGTHSVRSSAMSKKAALGKRNSANYHQSSLSMLWGQNEVNEINIHKNRSTNLTGPGFQFLPQRIDFKQASVKNQLYILRMVWKCWGSLMKSYISAYNYYFWDTWKFFWYPLSIGKAFIVWFNADTGAQSHVKKTESQVPGEAAHALCQLKPR